MLIKSEQQKQELKKQPKWIQCYIKDLEELVKTQGKMIDILIEQDESLKSDIVVYSKMKSFHFNKENKVEVRMDGGGSIYIEKDPEGKITILISGNLAFYPFATNCLRIIRRT